MVESEDIFLIQGSEVVVFILGVGRQMEVLKTCSNDYYFQLHTVRITYSSYLAEFIWRYDNRDKDLFRVFLNDVAFVYKL